MITCNPFYCRSMPVQCKGVFLTLQANVGKVNLRHAVSVSVPVLDMLLAPFCFEKNTGDISRARRNDMRNFCAYGPADATSTASLKSIFTFLGPAYPGCPGKQTVKGVIVAIN